MSYSSPNPFFSQDNMLSQLNNSIVTPSQPIVHPEDVVPSFDISSWVENVISSSCCSKKCTKELDKDELVKLKENYLSLSKREQEVMLLSLLQSFKKSRIGNQESYLYRLYPFDRICRNSFRLLFGLSNGRLASLCNHLKQNGIVCRVHGNSNRLPHNALTNVQKKLVTQWIHEYSEREGEPSPGRVREGVIREDGLIYLPAHLTIVEIYKVFELSKPNDSILMSFHIHGFCISWHISLLISFRFRYFS